jgi:hypothetical protein
MPRKSTLPVVEASPEVSSPQFEVVAVVTPPKVKKKIEKTIRIKNNLRQMVPLNIRNARGVTVGIEIPAYGERVWPALDNLGPDIAVKTRKKYLSILR